jgi:hypothetical protein
MRVRLLSFIVTAVIIAAGCISAQGPASAAAPSGALLPNIVMQPSRFSGPGIYTGKPALELTLSMILAGNGPQHFDTVALLKDLTGSKFDAEVDKLTKQYGKTKIDNFIKVYEFIVTDSLTIVSDKHIALPKTPVPDPHDGPALAQALWQAGQTGRGFNVEVLLDRLVSHPIHDQVMDDIDKKYGIAVDADYHAILNTALHDLAAVYGLH